MALQNFVLALPLDSHINLYLQESGLMVALEKFILAVRLDTVTLWFLTVASQKFVLQVYDETVTYIRI